MSQYLRVNTVYIFFSSFEKPSHAVWYLIEYIIFLINSCPAEPGYTLSLQTVQIQFSWLLNSAGQELICIKLRIYNSRFSLCIFMQNGNYMEY